ncbi:CDP-alcohol phosphatidyltransferase family protein [uncultured Methanobacterium sp.]|uniref:CDP-alcohol phosphatidyltransferase family protein n=1 Tax=uncultured Methanobacterium sp. TaxID=176306 RepID=UPI002AA74368|nr:CDP-alcohol phosphatidyltransferase family protein [uncultured Methanobacterium sp.]
MKNTSKKALIPSIVTALRLLVAPALFYTIMMNQYLGAILILIFAGFTDFLDGYLARRLDASSDSGAYLDVISDFILIVLGFTAFVLKGWYDPLILLLIIAMFALFLATSSLKKLVYDPVGKYLGAFLMFMLFVTLLFPEPLIKTILLILLVIICLISIISRFSLFLRRK